MRRADYARRRPNWGVSVYVSSWLRSSWYRIDNLACADLRHLDEAVEHVVAVADRAGFKRLRLRDGHAYVRVAREAEHAVAASHAGIESVAVRAEVHLGGRRSRLLDRRGLSLCGSECGEGAEQENGSGEQQADDEVEADPTHESS